jgi:hypothetical protein
MTERSTAGLPMAHEILPERVGLALDEEPRADGLVPFRVDTRGATSTGQPVTVGLPLPNGTLPDARGVTLTDPEGRRCGVQAEPLAWWPDRSVKWLLIDFVAGPSPAAPGRWLLGTSSRPDCVRRPNHVRVGETPETILVETGHASFEIDRRSRPLLVRARVGSRDVLAPGSARLVFKDRKGRESLPRVEQTEVETAGPIRVTIRTVGSFGGRSACRFVARTCFFAGTSLVRIRLTLHNPRRARHRGGLWDLGDRNSVLFRGLALEFGLDVPGTTRAVWAAEVGQAPRTSDAGSLAIDQFSSGGENWRSRNHVNRDGRQPCPYRGYRVRDGATESSGLRASPVVSLRGPGGGVAAAVPEFWQQFPKSIKVDGRSLTVGLFPEQFGDRFELQGGEQKTHTVWLDFSDSESRSALPLDWVHRPAVALAEPEWYGRSGALPEPGALPYVTAPLLAPITEAALDPDRGLVARREVIDEYGWRNYGDLYADHEGAHYPGPAPVVSHYNNQYDIVYGSILQYFRTGDSRWAEVFGPLARHVADIDIYHTSEDRAAYSGGLFWHTDHYRDAETSTHRAYSRSNRPVDGQPYGGGPCNEHNYTTGLWHYHLLTGDPIAREAVIGLAEWVIAMDDGSRTVLGLFDDGPTGLASCTQSPDYHGPGRGCGNSVNALLDGWEATGRRAYLVHAEALIRRTVHPAMDVHALHLLDVERRWSYTVFLSALARYLALKAELRETDSPYAYARESLLAFASWMLANETPYLDRPGELEYPTETWAAQELRKANVLRLAAAHADEPLRSALLRRGGKLSDRAWADLARFDSKYVTRSLAILLVEGTRDASFRAGAVAAALRPTGRSDFGAPETFLPQKRRVANSLRTAAGAWRALLGLSSTRVWRRFLAGPGPTTRGLGSEL